MKKIIPFGVGLICIVVNITGWSNQSTEGIWTQLTFNRDTARYTYLLQPQFRFNQGHVSVDEFLLNGGVGRKYQSLTLWLGGSYILNPQDSRQDIKEIRLWEQVQWQSPDRHTLQSRTRLEQRKASHFPQIANRFRQQITLGSPVQYGFRLLARDEIFINLNQAPWVLTKTWDQNRFFIGAEFYPIQHITMEVGYMYQYIFPAISQTRNLLQISLLTTFGQ